MSQQRGYTLDFTFESKDDGQVYIAEMKCELEFDGYRYLTLESPSQLDHHRNEAFRSFLDAAKNPGLYKVTVGGKFQPFSGSILVWGRCTEDGRIRVSAEYGFRDVLSLEAIIADLVAWQNRDFTDLLGRYQSWTIGLFAGLQEIGKEGSG
jgi:hypothetical protein